MAGDPEHPAALGTAGSAPAASGPVLTTAAATAAVVVAVTPSFMVGASGVLLRADLGFGTAGTGIAVSVFFGATALTSVLGGRVAERLGARRALVLVALTSGAVLLGIALLARSYAHLVVLLAVAGVANGIVQPASNMALARNAGNHQALTFGIKQSGITLATLVAGALVPLVGLTFGWRWSFAAAAAVAVAVAVLMPAGMSSAARRSGSIGSGRHGDAATAPLVVLALAAGSGMAAATAMASFTVESAVAGGLAVGVAGWLQVAGATAGVAARVLVGWVADRYRGIALAVSAGMLLAGACGYAVLAFAGPRWILLGTLVGYACGWGWTGLLMFAVVRFNPRAPAVATGIVMTGSASGAALGPFVFGQVAQRLSFEAAWTMGTCLALVSMLLVSVARSWLLRDRRRREARVAAQSGGG